MSIQYHCLCGSNELSCKQCAFSVGEGKFGLHNSHIFRLIFLLYWQAFHTVSCILKFFIHSADFTKWIALNSSVISLKSPAVSALICWAVALTPTSQNSAKYHEQNWNQIHPSYRSLKHSAEIISLLYYTAAANGIWLCMVL